MSLVRHIKVWVRLQNRSNGSGQSEVLQDKSGNLVLSSATEAGKVHQYDRVLAEDEIPETEIKDRISSAMNGFNVALLNFGIGENIPAKGKFVNYIFTVIKKLITKQDVVSFSALGINDHSCVDLIDYTKSDFNPKTVWENLKSTDLKELDGMLKNEATLPLFVLFKFVRRLSSSATVEGTLLLGELGGTCLSAVAPGPLDKSVAELNKLILEMEQPYGEAQVKFDQTIFTALLQRFVGGNSEMVILCDVVQNGSLKALVSGFLLLDVLRKVKSFPKQNFVDEKIQKLLELEVLTDSLQVDKQQAYRDIRELKKGLEQLNEERRILQKELDLQACSSECERFEKEYLSATMELQCLDLKDQLRKVEIELVSLDQMNLQLSMEKKRVLKEKQAAEREFKKREEEFGEKEKSQRAAIEGLEEKLGDAGINLDFSKKEADLLKHEIEQANATINSLTRDLARTAEAHEKLLDRTMKSPTKTLQEREITSLRQQLEATKLAEEKLSTMLQKNEERADQHQKLMSELEKQLNEVKMENFRLQQLKETKEAISREVKEELKGLRELKEVKESRTSKEHNQVINSNQEKSELTKRLSRMEAEWKAEREEMQAMLLQVKETIEQKRRARESSSFEASPIKKETTRSKPSKLIEKSTERSTGHLTVGKIESVATNRVDGVKDSIGRKRPTIPTNSSEGKEGEKVKDFLKQSQPEQVQKVISQIKAVIPEAPPKPLPKKMPLARKRKDEPLALSLDPKKLKPQATVPVPPQEAPPVQPDLATVDSPSKFKPSSFIPKAADPKAVENSQVLANLSIFKDRLDNTKRLKIPEKPTPLAGTLLPSLRSKTTVAVDQSALSNIVSNLTVTLPKKT